jgi:hypothetical protein
MNTPTINTYSTLQNSEHSTNQSFADHESGLWRAVITQALMDAASRSRKPEAIHNRQEALEWLLGLTPDFESVCDNAGLNPDYVRTEARKALHRGFIWRLPAGQGWRTKTRREAPHTIPATTH